MRAVILAIALALLAGMCLADGINGAVSGFVLLSNSTPVVNALAVLSTGPNTSVNTTSNATGEYNFTGLNYSTNGSNYSVRAFMPGDPSTFTSTYNLTFNDTNYTIFQNLTFSGGSPPGGSNGTNGSISGVVYMPFGGFPASNFSVTLGGSANRNTTTNSSGGFSFANLSWPGGYVLQARGTGFQDKMVSNFFNLNLNSGNYVAVQDLNLTDQMSGGGCMHNGTFAISGFLKNSSGVMTGISLNVELKSRNATCGPYDPSCWYASGPSNTTTGAYTLGCLEAGDYYLLAMGGGDPNNPGPGYMSNSENISIVASNLTGQNITLSRDTRGPQGCGGSASIFGYVTDSSSGSGVSNVNVFAGVSGNSGPSQNFCGGGAITSSNGSYTISGLSAGSYQLNVMPPSGSGYAEIHLSPQNSITLAGNSSSAQRDFSLERSGGVAGCVVGNNSGTLNPLQNAFVSLMSPTPGGSWAGGQTDANGCFNLSAASGSYGINVNPPYGSNYATYQMGMGPGESTITVTSGSTTTIANITLRQGAKIRGYVLMSNGSGIQNVGVNARPKMMFGPGGGGEFGFGFTNSIGYFEIAGLLENSTYVLEAHPSPDSDYSSASAEVQMTSATMDANLTLSSGNRVQGRVTCLGAPVQYSNIQIFSAEGGSKGPGGPMMGGSESGTFAFAMTDSNGDYSARGLRPGTFNLRAETPWNSQISCSSNSTTINVSSGTNTVNVTLPAAATLTGIIKDGAGSPIAFAFVNAFIPNEGRGPEMGPSAFAQSAANGSYTLSLSPSATPYIVSVQPPWGSTYASGDAQVNITASGTTYYRNFTLTSGGSIRGRVVKSDGSAVQFAFVNAFSENAHSFGFASTSSDGTFDVRGLSAATDYRLFIQPPSTAGGIVPTFVEGVAVAQGSTTDLGTITASSADSSLAVTITNNNSAVASARVHAWLPFTPFFGACTTNSSGQCNITGLSSGSYDVFIDGSGRPPVFSNATVSGATSFSFDFATSLGSIYTVNGTVGNGTANLTSADVGIWSEARRFGMHSLTDANGAFSFSGVPGGTYSLGARKLGYYEYHGSITVGSDTMTSITLSPFSAGSQYAVSGYLQSATNSSVSSKTVVLFDSINASKFSAFNITNGSGFYTIGGVPSSNYTITAALGNQTFSQNASVGADTTVNITVS